MAGEDTQLDDRTEEATPERREEWREKGQVVVSREITHVFVLGGAMLFMTSMLPLLLDKMQRLLISQFQSISTRRIDATNILGYALSIWTNVLYFIVPLFLVTMVASIGTTFLQTRLNWSWSRLSPDFTRMNPWEGLKKIVSMQAIVELLKSTGKLGAVILITWLILKGEWDRVPELMMYPMTATWGYWAAITKQLFWAVAGLMLVIAGSDYAYSFFTHERKIKMTKQEVKEEYKRRESDPHLKNRMRRMARELATRKVLDKTKEATVIITNPTHFSIAIKYEFGMAAPIVVAKGIDFLALRMREVAKEHKIPLVENRPLARELYATVDEGEEIPVKLYKVTSEIIRYVFKLKGVTINPRKKPESPQ